MASNVDSLPSVSVMGPAKIQYKYNIDTNTISMERFKREHKDNVDVIQFVLEKSNTNMYYATTIIAFSRTGKLQKSTI